MNPRESIQHSSPAKFCLRCVLSTRLVPRLKLKMNRASREDGRKLIDKIKLDNGGIDECDIEATPLRVRQSLASLREQLSNASARSDLLRSCARTLLMTTVLEGFRQNSTPKPLASCSNLSKTPMTILIRPQRLKIKYHSYSCH